MSFFNSRVAGLFPSFLAILVLAQLPCGAPALASGPGTIPESEGLGQIQEEGGAMVFYKSTIPLSKEEEEQEDERKRRWEERIEELRGMQRALSRLSAPRQGLGQAADVRFTGISDRQSDGVNRAGGVLIAAFQECKGAFEGSELKADPISCDGVSGTVGFVQGGGTDAVFLVEFHGWKQLGALLLGAEGVWGVRDARLQLNAGIFLPWGGKSSSFRATLGPSARQEGRNMNEDVDFKFGGYSRVEGESYLGNYLKASYGVEGGVYVDGVAQLKALLALRLSGNRATSGGTLFYVQPQVTYEKNWQLRHGQEGESLPTPPSAWTGGLSIGLSHPNF